MKVKNIYKIFSISVIFVALIISIIAMSTYSLDEELEDSFTGALLIWPVGEMVNTLPSQGNIHGFKSHTGHHYKYYPLNY